MNVKFLAFYDLDEFKNENRNNPLSSRYVCDYIISKLLNNGYNVEVISPAETKSKKGYFKSRSNISNGVKVTLGPTLGSENKYIRIISVFLTRIWFVLYMLKNIKEDDVIIAWHQIPLMEPVIIFRKLTRKRNLFVLNVGEIYQKVVPEKITDSRKKREIEFISNADRYILSTFGIKNYANIEDKLCIELPGTLVTIEDRKPIFEDGKIHILYSGVINNTKGAYEAIEMMDYLDDNYVLHILGWGQEPDSIEKLIKKINEKEGRRSKVFYEGVKRGSDYEDYLLSCHIGLCSQDTSAVYNDCSFPSKILTYLGANLKVICTDVVAVKNSSVSRMITFVDSNEPLVLAEAVKQMDRQNNMDTRETMVSIGEQFEKSLIRLMNEQDL